MIRFALKCGKDHGFDSWFASAEAFETLQRANMVACPECGGTDVSKTLMAPQVRPARKAASAPGSTPARPLAAPASEAEKALAAMRAYVEKNSDYVGMSFAAEARKMHEGEVPHRSIYGEARLQEARALIEDGIPVAPLPFLPTRKTN